MHSPQNDETDEQPRHTAKHSAHKHKSEPRYEPKRSYYYSSHSRSYYSDEHPEVPRVRRASLQVEAEDTPPQVSTEKVRRTIKKAPSTPDATRSRRLERERHNGTSSLPPSRGSERGTHRQTPQVRRNYSEEQPRRSPQSGKMARPHTRRENDFFEDFEEYTEHNEAVPHTSSRIMVTQRRRPPASTVYEPPSSSSRHSRGRRKRRRNPLLAPLQRLGQNRSFMLTASIIIVVLILLPIIIHGMTRTQAQVVTVSGSGMGGVTVNQPGSTQSNPVKRTFTVDGILVTPNNFAHPAPPVLATSAYLLDANTGATLYASNPNMRLPMMSTTKLMTAVLAVEHGNPDQKITINNAISNDLNQLSADSSVMGIKKGETYTLRDLLYGLLLMSGNDAAVAIADGISGSLPKFVTLMNQRAAQLGLHNTHYANPHGLLNANHFSSARDLALLGKFSLSIALIHQISGTKNYRITRNGTHAEHNMFNGNQFLWWYPGVDGGKPGWDGDKNFVQVVSCVRNGHHLIGVVMHTSDWWTDMRDLMNWGFNTFQWVSPRLSDKISTIPYDSDWGFFTRDQQNKTLPTGDNGRYYIFTGYSVSGAILSYFDKNGGLRKFGYPTDLPRTENNALLKQRFEHSTIQCDITSRHCSTV